MKPSHIQLEYEQLGDPNAPPIILIMGLYGQMIDWPDSFCEILVEAGFQVIRFDNRDIGLSQRLEHLSPPNPYNASFYLTWGLKPPAPYNLDDMASDVMGLMDALKLKQAHVVGSSMGGMIGQILACEEPDRVLSLCCLSSTTGSPFLPTADWRLWPLILNPASIFNRPDSRKKLELLRLLASPAYLMSDESLIDWISVREERSPDCKGLERQLAAALNTGDISSRITSVKCPTLVLNGDSDRLVRPACGKDIAKKIPGAKFEMIPGWGHDFPEALSKVIAEKLIQHLITADEVDCMV